MEIKINEQVSIEVADTYLYTIHFEGYPYKILWSEEYAKERAGYLTYVDTKNPNAPAFTPDVTKKIYKTIKAIKAFVKCGQIIY